MKKLVVEINVCFREKKLVKKKDAEPNFPKRKFEKQIPKEIFLKDKFEKQIPKEIYLKENYPVTKFEKALDDHNYLSQQWLLECEGRSLHPSSSCSSSSSRGKP